jgi:hypothetical protein
MSSSASSPRLAISDMAALMARSTAAGCGTAFIAHHPDLAAALAHGQQMLLGMGLADHAIEQLLDALDVVCHAGEDAAGLPLVVARGVAVVQDAGHDQQLVTQQHHAASR